MTSHLPAIRGRVFVDTGSYYGIADERDETHAEAIAIGRHLATSPVTLFTTNFILAESHALALARRNRRVALALLQEILRTASTIVRVSTRDEARALAIIMKHDDKNYSYTDATSFAVMERLHIQQAFTFDRNFFQYGFAVSPEQAINGGS